MADPTHTAFFYGTLMAPAVLHRVCDGTASHNDPTRRTTPFTTAPAILHDYRRHRVEGADYPAILPTSGASVRGTYVTGLTEADMWRLDIFEGSDYERKFVKCKLLTEVGDEEGKGNVKGEEVEAETYVWVSEREDLEDREWDFREFQREKLRFWAGTDDEYEEVDEAVAAAGKDGTGGRGANGAITEALKEEQKKDEKLRNAV
ncbi:uncharacterized protein LTR77_007972 [Saxophila tyrrhenica]|uniref:Putative gamma-glutamylcyclotransferase n=1 Tax=Saxophila tyrrhenica TaxID=1690608 RepID=A0AAV9P213_9PEZI|nr:hypothetical protein LTR77_007972 [Saxophila tyrrhenica]